MKIILFGATGMVGQGVLRECLVDSDIERVLVVGRSRTGRYDAKLTEVLHDNFFDLSSIESELTGYDACFFCLGVSLVGMDAERYRRLTYDLTMTAATALAKLNPGMVFTYVTGRGTRSPDELLRYPGSSCDPHIPSDHAGYALTLMPARKVGGITVQPHCEKFFASLRGQITGVIHAILSQPRGVSRSS